MVMSRKSVFDLYLASVVVLNLALSVGMQHLA
jgi:hypothetical protein